MAQYIPIGKPANEAEKEGFRLLRDRLPDHYLVLGNFDLRLPGRRASLEFDAVVIGEYGFYAVEIKGWSGDIQGGARNWLLPWGKVSNPLNHLDKKIKVLAHFVRGRVREQAEKCFYQPALLFPREVRLDVPENMRSSIVLPDEIYEYFVDMELVHKNGPGPFRCRERSQAVVDAIVTLAEPSEGVSGPPYYDVEGELNGDDLPYREYVGSHQYLQGRSKVRIKAYTMDSLASKANLRQERNRVLRDMEALDVLDDNPYVARSYEMQPDYEDDLIFYLISEWVGPRTLRDYLEDRPAEDWDDRECYQLCHHLLEAVASIHDAGIVHRNLSPAVIYLPDEEGTMPLKLADFDFARVTQLESIADALSHIGTNGYKAPEIWLESDYDHRVDVFSLGAILFEMLTSKLLFEGPGTLLRPAEVWSEYGPLVQDEQIRRLIESMISDDMERRSQAMAEARKVFAKLANRA